MDISQDKMDTIASYMDDDIREMIHGSTEDPLEFLEAYLEKDPSFADLLYHEFNDIYQYFYGTK